MDAFIRFLAVVLAIILLLLFPLQYIAQLQDESIEDVVHAHVHEFTETARNQGSISLSMYESLEEKLAKTGEQYNLSVTVSHPVTAQELDTVNSDLENANFRVLNEAGSSNKGGFRLLATHTHTNDCYAGHRHTAECYITADSDINYARGLDGVTITLLSDTTSGWITSTKRVDVKCSTCSQVIASAYVRKTSKPFAFGDAQLVRYYHGTEYGSTGQKIKIFSVKERLESNTYIPGYIDRGSNYSTDHNYRYCAPTDNPEYTNFVNILNTIRSNPTASQTELLGLLNQIGFNSDMACWNCAVRQNKPVVTYHAGDQILVCRETQDVTPICNQVVISITATNPTQTVTKGGSMITTATATYLDGHTATVNCTSNFNPNLVGNQTVTLTYTGLVGNAKTVGSRTCTVNVTVMESNIPSFLTVTPSAYTVYNGNKPTFTVVVTYKSGNTKTIPAGSYTESGWSAGPGTKTITFSYTENSVTVTKTIAITVLPNISGLSVTPSSQSVKRYAQPSFTVTVLYENSTSKVITSGYTVSGLNNKNLGTQTASISYTENSITKNATAAVTFTKLTSLCPVCGSTYELDENDTDRGCPVCGSKVLTLEASPYRVTVNRGEALPITVTATYQNGFSAAVSGWTSNYDPNVIGTRQVEISYQGVKCSIIVQTLPGKVTCPICGNSYDLNPDGTDPGCPICSVTVTGITIQEDSVTIEKFDLLPITVTAKYRDNHTAVIYDWSTNFVPDRAGVYEVTVYYGDFTDTVMVKVLDEEEIICPICGTVYTRSESPNGCPVCSVTLTGIKAKLRNGGTQVIYKSEIRLEITLIFRDNHEELVYSGYSVTGYDPEVLGFQDIIVHYKELTTTLRIEVIKGPARVVCPKGHEYYLNEDSTDPGCPICDSASKEGVISYFEATYTPEILQVLIETGEYHLKKGDYITVTIKARDTSIRSKLRKMFFGTSGGIAHKRYTYGGEVY